MTDPKTLSQSKNARKILIAGNWKMNKTRVMASEFFDGFSDFLTSSSHVTRDVDLWFGVAATLFDVCQKFGNSYGLKILAQNVHFEPQGAFTGEISTSMLLDAHVTGSIIGHSERRQYFGETDISVGKKWNALSKNLLTPIVCIGELRSEREAGQTKAVLGRQLDDALRQVDAAALSQDFVLAYEPVWAIGTGLSATPEMAEEAHHFIRSHISQVIGTDRANRIRILYGGSMNAANAESLLSMPNIDGGLIGGASLQPPDFIKIVIAALKCSSRPAPHC